ncbi:NfeD family protein [Gephyromycinifex aptenodytis]|uniref:NfeD family protein n=1 Tax=Gephyromycinifex aptenodytis TaxID=2716227 RepID=UPI001446C08F|nr:NfeD family protein [Gephyromycinifex aptenodytis]
MDWFIDNSWAIWLALALTLGAVEAATVDFVFLMLAGGALAGAVAGGLHAPVEVQLILASVVAVLLLVGVRPVVKRKMLDNLPDAGLGVAAYEGKVARVTAPVDQTDGRVYFEGEEWSARTEESHLAPLPVHSRVRVVRVDGATLIVLPTPPIQDVTRENTNPA